MTTHQEDFHRMCLTGWLIGRFRIGYWIECGVLEGETVGYFSQLVQEGRGAGCDMNVQALGVGRHRYSSVRFDLGDATHWLERLDPPHCPKLFYLDTCWNGSYSNRPNMDVIQRRWPGSPVMVNNVRLPHGHWAGTNLTPVEELQPYGRVIVPDYSHSIPVAGYGVVVPDDAELPPLKHWKVLPKT